MFKRDKTKGVEGLVDVVNPNRVAVKSKKVTDIDVNSEAVLSRRERSLVVCVFVMIVHVHEQRRSRETESGGFIS